jgi:CBS domain-containing protein
MAVVRGVLIAIPILVVFLALLTSADLVFADAVQDALRWLDLERLARWFRGALVVTFSGLFFLGALVLALRDPDKRSTLSLERPTISPFLGFIEAMVVLGAVDLLFIIFVVIQFAYLFGGEANITAAGYTYSEYARRGFGELVAVAVLSLGLIYSMSTLTKREERSRMNWFNGLSVVLVGLVGVILTSALRRLLLYENAYGFTRLRTYTHVAIFWMGVVFIAFLITLLSGRLRRFAPLVVLIICGFVASLGLLNIDAFIVKRNLERHAATGQIDIQYLMGLSEDAIPGIVKFVKDAPDDVREELLAQLACREYELARQMEQLSWQSYNFARASASMWLGNLEDELGIFVVEPEAWGLSVRGPGVEMRCVQHWD